MADPGKVLVLGADGFIGRHIAFELRNAGWQVLAHARRPERLAAMGFEVLKADLTQPDAASADFWQSQVAGVTHFVNAAGVLNASDSIYNAVHLTAPAALYKALGPQARGVLISAVGIDVSETDFARYRRKGEALASKHSMTILRPGLVLGDTSYGGSSLARALSALPFVTPVVGDGTQQFNPVHVADLARIVDSCLQGHHQDHALQEIGGPQTVTQADMLSAYRGWLGLNPARLLRLPLPIARKLGQVGDLMQLGPISATAVAQLSHSVLAANAHPQARGFTEFLRTRPAGTQDLWQARLYLMRPVLRIVLALLWLASGLLGLFLPSDHFLPLVPALPDTLAILMARGGGVVDLAIAYALLRGIRPRLLAGLQAGMVLIYTLAFTLLAPFLWLLPLGGLLKNLPILALIAIAAVLEEER
ncbi:MAG: SDR family oxidoreductase [Pelagimonas sp.]|jgi:uncharacterized protein YbjT (DUF2867 family)/uncharacterized membrane protein YphA (DoxX/SURF4 family)|nr:SDR family oxidoreductase [Pelagimonas sp.]